MPLNKSEVVFFKLNHHTVNKWSSEHCHYTVCHHLVGLVVKASASRAEDPGSIPASAMGILPDQVIPVT